MLYEAKRLSDHAGARILLKREDLNHTGAHKIRNVLGQALLTKRMGKKRVIAETGAGQHGVASATAAAYLGLDCTVYMGEVDTERQALNVARMQLLGAEVIPVTSGSRTLKDAINEALRDWVSTVDHTAYLFGTAAGPHPFPSLVLSFVRGIGDEARRQCLDLTGRLPDAIAACVGGGSNAIGLFAGFLDDPEVADLRLRAGRRRRRDRSARGDDPRRSQSASCTARARSSSRTTTARPSSRTRSRPASTTPASDRSTPTSPTSDGRPTCPSPTRRRWTAMALLARTEGIIPAIESAHAIAGVVELAKERPGADDPGQPVGPRRQGHGHRADLLRARRREDRHAVSGASVSTAFEKARAEGRAALVGYLPAGYPDVQGGIDALKVLVDAGCDVIEIGLPYSDPVMDGPTIQAAAQQALESGVRTTDVLRTVEAVAATGVPTLVMTYWNPVERYGVERFAADLANAGGAGLITPDLTPDFAARVDRRRRRARARQGLPRRAVVDRRAHRHDDRGLPRLRLRHRGHGRHRRPRRDQRPGRPAGGAHPQRGPDLPDRRRASASATATRPPRWRPTPTPSSWARPSCACSSTTSRRPRRRAAGAAALTADLADGVRRAP